MEGYILKLKVYGQKGEYKPEEDIFLMINISLSIVHYQIFHHYFQWHPPLYKILPSLFSTLLELPLRLSSLSSIGERVIYVDVDTSFVQDLLHSHIDGSYFHIPISSNIKMSSTLLVTPLITFSP